MNEKHEGSWCCIVGKNMIANITHEPGYFLRLSNIDFHFIIFRLKEDEAIIKTEEYDACLWIYIYIFGDDKDKINDWSWDYPFIFFFCQTFLQQFIIHNFLSLNLYN